VLAGGEDGFEEADEEPDVDVHDQLHGDHEVGGGQDRPAQDPPGEGVEPSGDYGGERDEEEEGSAGPPEEQTDFPVEERPRALEPPHPGQRLGVVYVWEEGGERQRFDVDVEEFGGADVSVSVGVEVAEEELGEVSVDPVFLVADCGGEGYASVHVVPFEGFFLEEVSPFGP